MRISWFTIIPTPATVQYGLTPSADSFNATGVTDSYRYMTFYSGPVHNVVIGPLNPNTIYYYRMGDSTKIYTMKTPPSQFPIKFAVVGKSLKTNYNKIYFFALIEIFFGMYKFTYKENKMYPPSDLVD
ncbi:putative Acid phosphatase [Lupinus albus]|uniref:Putative Acid phosphatase n=1 Tax=Lupinus albus TaxID=3870 RepID=A0A6A4N4Y8_LUPAL|nr:putative Acid phosphatase [Lupinus albus]